MTAVPASVMCRRHRESRHEWRRSRNIHTQKGAVTVYTHLIALNPSRQLIVKVAIADGTIADFITGVTGFPDGIVVNPDGNAVYWTNMGAPGLPADHPPRQEFLGRRGLKSYPQSQGISRNPNWPNPHALSVRPHNG